MVDFNYGSLNWCNRRILNEPSTVFHQPEYQKAHFGFGDSYIYIYIPGQIIAT